MAGSRPSTSWYSADTQPTWDFSAANSAEPVNVRAKARTVPELRALRPAVVSAALGARPRRFWYSEVSRIALVPPMRLAYSAEPASCAANSLYAVPEVIAALLAVNSAAFG